MKFRPLRRLKSGKIAVASYSSWRTIRPSIRSGMSLTVDISYRTFEPSALVYNHRGENLFFKDFDPNKIPVFTHPFDIHTDTIKELYKSYGIRWHAFLGINYNCQGLDCEGVPTFSHGTMENIANGNRLIESIDEYEPLTVEIVTKFWGWFLQEAEFSELTLL